MLLMAWAQARYSGESVLVDKYMSLESPHGFVLAVNLHLV